MYGLYRPGEQMKSIGVMQTSATLSHCVYHGYVALSQITDVGGTTHRRAVVSMTPGDGHVAFRPHVFAQHWPFGP